MAKFEIRNDAFFLSGAPFRIISGSIHYFRIPRQYWKDRLKKLQLLGCNTVETYVPWNLHEPEPGKYVFSEDLDICEFLTIAQELGLYAIVRPSPYICAEWEFGGLPAWLLRSQMRLRSSDALFLTAVERYYAQLMPILAAHQLDRGGNILLMQVENEYGAYGTDKKYLEKLVEIMRGHGITVPFVTSDGPWNGYLRNGSISGVLATANFGSKADEQFAVLKKHLNGAGPLMCMEFWVGWFDAWGDQAHHVTDGAVSAQDLDLILQQGSVNIYMFCGGTSFGWMNGSNNTDHLTPDVTSYDYDALLTEDGRITEKYLQFRKVIAKYVPLPPLELPQDAPRCTFGPIPISASAPLLEHVHLLAHPIQSPWPMSMECLGQSYGYILYRCALPQSAPAKSLRLMGTADRAQIFLDGVHVQTGFDRELSEPFIGDFLGKQMDILVENLGRVNYGPYLEQQRKGISGNILLDDVRQSDLTIYSLPLTAPQLQAIPFGRYKPHHEPAFYRALFDVKSPADTYLDLSNWGKGIVFLNKVPLGRFWNIGPQKRLYLPAPMLRQGENEIIIFETEGISGDQMDFFREPY